MKVKDTMDLEKAELQKTVDTHKNALQTQAVALGDRTQEFVNTALMIGGAVAAGYVMYRLASGGKKSGVLGTILTAAASALATEKGRDLLIAGKNKLTEMLKPE